MIILIHSCRCVEVINGRFGTFFQALFKFSGVIMVFVSRNTFEYSIQVLFFRGVAMWLMTRLTFLLGVVAPLSQRV